MKILHVCLSCFYIDNYSYQENLLPKYHKKLGYDVKILASLMSFDKNGNQTYLSHAGEYINEYGIPVKRIPFKHGFKIDKILKCYKGTYEAIEEFNPDVIFIHGVQFIDIGIVVKYLKTHNSVKVFVDNHSDFSNSATNWISKNIQHKILWKHFAQKINPYVTKFYGVLPARVDFLVNMYSLPKEKVELLVMGADDELVEKSSLPEVKKRIREQYNIKEDDFLIVTGGKIDQWKKQTLLLMDAVKQFTDSKIKLIVFGSVTQELKSEVERRISDRVQYIGWIKSEDSYNYFAASNLVVFPGRHSVFWEQVAGQGIPMICKYWDGTTHIDGGGNVKLLYQDTVDEIYNSIKLVYLNEYQSMYNCSKIVKNRFLYSEIARKSLEE